MTDATIIAQQGTQPSAASSAQDTTQVIVRAMFAIRSHNWTAVKRRTIVAELLTLSAKQTQRQAAKALTTTRFLANRPIAWLLRSATPTAPP